MTSPEGCREAAEQIAADVYSRRGIGDEWGLIDRNVREEIIDRWAEIILERLERYDAR